MTRASESSDCDMAFFSPDRNIPSWNQVSNGAVHGDHVTISEGRNSVSLKGDRIAFWSRSMRRCSSMGIRVRVLRKESWTPMMNGMGALGG